MNNEDINIMELDEKQILPRFPLSKIKKIAKCDQEYIITSNTAIVATSFATELFIQALTEDGLSMSYLQQDKKFMKRNSNNMTTTVDNGSSDTTRKQVRLTLDNLIESVQRNEQFYFLEDVIGRKNFNNDSKGGKKDKSGIMRSTDSKHTKNNKILLDVNQSVLPFGKKETTVETLKNVDNSESENDDQQEADEENIIDGVEEEEEEEEDTGEGIPQDVDGNSDNEVELQRELEKMNTVEDIDDQTDDDDDDDSNEGIRSRERLVGREETTEEIFE